METFARSYVLWPNMNTVITQTVKNCHECQLNANSPTKVPIHPWDWTDKLWVRLDLNYARSYRSKMFLIVVDSFSKWIDIIPTFDATPEETQLRSYVLPLQILQCQNKL